MARLSLALLIPTWRRPAPLMQLLSSLQQQTRSPDEIIISCRPDDTSSLDVIDQWLKVSPMSPLSKIAFVHEQGHIPPVVAALEISRSDIICQIDDDAIPHRDWLAYIEEDFGLSFVGAVGGRTINHVDSSSSPGILEPGRLSWFGRSGSCRRPDGQQLYEADCLIGVNMAYRRKAAVDTMDMSLNGGSAISYETDLALNMRKLGYKVYYDPRMIVDHYPAIRHINAERGWNQSECFWYSHNMTYIGFKHLSWYGRLGFLIYFFLGGTWGCPGPITFLLGLCMRRPASFSRQLIPSIKGRLAGIRTYVRMRFKTTGPQNASERI